MGGRRTLSDAQQRFEALTSLLKDIESGGVVTSVGSNVVQHVPIALEQRQSQIASGVTISPVKSTPVRPTTSNGLEDDALDLIERNQKLHSGQLAGAEGLRIDEEFLAQLLRVDLRTSATIDSRLGRPGENSVPNPESLSLYRALALSKRKAARAPVTEGDAVDEEEGSIREAVGLAGYPGTDEEPETTLAEPLQFAKPLVGLAEALRMLDEVNQRNISAPSPLDLGFEREETGEAIAEAVEEHNDARKVLLEKIALFRRDLPLTFLMEHNLNELGQRQGVETVMAIMRRFVNALKAQALEIWKEYTEGSKRKEAEDAAVKIQTLYRGCKARMLSHRRKMSSTRSVQQEMRARSGDIQLRILSSVVLQRFVRGYFGRRIAAEARLVLKRVIHLQSLCRKKICSMHLVVLLEHSAFKNRKATAIQRMVRGMFGRKRAYQRRVEVDMEERDKLLQDPGNVLRRKFIEVAAVYVISRAWKAYKFRRTVRFHGSIFAVKIQRVVRGHIARVRTRPKLKFARFQTWVFDASDFLTPFAIRIQRSFQTMQSRKRLKLLRRNAFEARARRIEEKKKLLEASKHKLIKTMNPAKAVRLLKNTRAARDSAAVKIQARWRGFRARAYFKALKRKEVKKKRQDAAVLLQLRWRGYIARQAFLHKQEMARSIQRFWRARNVYMLQRKAERSFIALQVVRRTADSVLQEWQQEASRLVAKHLGLAQSKIAKHVRGRTSRLEFSLRLDKRRADAESKLAGMLALEAAFLQERDRLLILALYEHSKDICQFEPFQVFMERCDVQAVDPRWTRSRGPHLGGAAFARLCKDAGLSLGGKAKGGSKKRQKVSTNAIDLVFAKAQADISKGSKVMQYPGFVRAMEILGDKVYPEVTSLRKLKDVDARVVLLFEQYIFGSKHIKALNGRVHARLRGACAKIQSIYRMKKSKHVLQMCQLVEARSDELKKQAGAALFIQTRFRQFRARQKYFRMVRSTFACYKDIELDVPYWMNPRTGFTSWTKPSILGAAEVDNVILVPPIRHQFVVYCERCETYGVREFCIECEELQCKSCFEDFHKKGSRATHSSITVEQCVNCLFQVASRRCKGCKNDCYCDICWENLHKKVNVKDHAFDLLLELCQVCTSRAARYSEGGYQCCSYCLENSFGVSTEERVPMALHTLAMERERTAREVQQQKQAQEQLANLRERERVLSLQQSAAVTLQRYFRGWAIRRSSVGITVVRALEDVQARRKEAEANKPIVRILAKGVKQLSKGMAKKLGERLNELDSNGLDILSKLPRPRQRESTDKLKPWQELAAAEKPSMSPECEKGTKIGVQQATDHEIFAQSSVLETQPNEHEFEKVEDDVWRELYDDENMCSYYYNEQTGESRWEHPEEEGGGEEAWERHYDESSGHYYFINTLTGEAVWEESQLQEA